MALRDPLLRAHRDAIVGLAARYGASNVRVFGSRARGTADATSDLDLLVDLAPDRSLLDLGGLLMDLRDLLGIAVDVGTVQMLKPRIRERVLGEAEPL